MFMCVLERSGGGSVMGGGGTVGAWVVYLRLFVIVCHVCGGFGSSGFCAGCLCYGGGGDGNSGLCEVGGVGVFHFSRFFLRFR